MADERAPVKVIGTNIFYKIDMTSKSGRLIGEYTVGEPHVSQAKAEGIDMTLTACPYNGFRKGLPMHLGALKEVAGNWEGVLDGLNWINHVMLAGRKFKRNVPPHAVFELAEAGHCLPDFLVNRRENPYLDKGDIPDVIADIPKVTAGFRTAGGFLIADSRRTSITPEFIADYSEEEELFRSEDGERVCAGSPPQIVEAGKALIMGKGGDWRKSVLNDVIPDPNKFRSFAKGHVRVTFDTHGFKTYIAETITIMDRAPDLAKLMIVLDYENAEAEYLKSMNECQIRINRALGFADQDIPVLDSEDVENEVEYSPRTYMRDLGIVLPPAPFPGL